MSPAPSRPKSSRAGVSRVKEWKVRGTAKGLGLSGTRSVGVKIEGGKVIVTWLEGTPCARRAFTEHDLKQFILYMDGIGHRYRDMWLEFMDSGVPGYSKRKYYVRVNEDGGLTANERPMDHGFIPWESFKHALEEALGELDSES